METVVQNGVGRGLRAGCLVLCLALAACGGGSPGRDASPLDVVFGGDVADAGAEAGPADEGPGRDLAAEPGTDALPDGTARDADRDGPAADARDLPGDADAGSDVPVPCQPEGAACNDGDKCTVDDACRSGECRGEPVHCPDDGLPCTPEACVAGACQRGLLEGYCQIDGRCWTDGQADPANTCRRCRTGRSTVEWTPADGQPCDDGDACTQDDVCAAGGTCAGTPRTCADDGFPCTLDACRAGDCVHEPADGWCLADGTCLEAGRSDPANPCRGCDPGAPLSFTAWVGKACDDGDPCSLDDACGADAACRGVPLSCPDDGIPCTLESCRDGACVRDLPERTCTIDGTCWAEGQRKPGDACRACLAGVDAGAWSIAAGARCDDGDSCTTGDACNAAGACVGSPVPCAPDDLPCTVDACVAGTCRHVAAAGFCAIDGACRADGEEDPAGACRFCHPASAPDAWTVRVDASCDDGDPCTREDLCRADGTCAGVAMSCPSDGLPCTQDVCVDGACANPVLAGYCLADGACRVDGQPDPGNACRACDADVRGDGWTARVGAACDDGDACTVTDQCGADGTCAGTPVTCPGDGLPCTDDRCVAGSCRHDVQAGTCLVAGACWNDGQADPANGCRACRAATSQGAWTVTPGVACDDGNPCTANDQCGAAGTCAGTAVSCPSDGLPCTTDHCVAGVCRNDVQAGFCAVGGTCWTDGQPDPADACRGCDAAVSATAWTLREGAACDDGDGCTSSDQCRADGTCRGTAVRCPPDALPCTLEQCVDGSCRTTVASGFCAIAGACWSDGQADPANGCRACAAATNDTAWTIRTGAACDDGDGCTTGDLCQANGVCAGGAAGCASDGLPCTTDQCVGGQCRHDVLPGYCVIAGACWTDGQADPSDACRGCSAAASATAWTARVGTACDDRDACTTSDQCQGNGTCAGTAVACPSDGLPCTTDHCVSGACRNDVAAGYCVIDGFCWTDGQGDPLDACLGCDAGALPTGWSPRDGIPCEDGDPCTTPDTCGGGACQPGPDTCPPPVCSTHAECFSHGGKICGLWKTAGENRCSTPCTGASGCAAGEICSRVPGSANVGYCQPMPNPAGTPDFGTCGDNGQSCQPDLCTDTFCSPHCGGQPDCPAGGQCLPAGDFTNGMQGVCEPTSALSGLKPYGAACTNDGYVWDSSLCRSGHCDLSAWYFMEYGGYPYTARCTNLCTTDADCTGPYGDECNLVMHSNQAMADAIPLDTGVAPTWDGVLGCYTRRYISGANRSVGDPCTAPKDCRTNKCFGFSGVSGQYCTTFCGGDADCPSPMVCELASVNLVSWWLAMDANQAEGAFTLVRICVLKP